MSKIRIEWTSDNYDCETCGGSWAEGARVYKDGEVWLDLEPLAHCFGGANYPTNEVYNQILRALGHEVEE
jgi:hypothetical protein